jgi:hypothetical protein
VRRACDAVQCATVLRSVVMEAGLEGVEVVASVESRLEGSSSDTYTPSTAPASSIIVATPQSIMSHFPTLADVRQWSVVVGDEARTSPRCIFSNGRSMRPSFASTPAVHSAAV